ncbi:MAG: protein phosphatase 2C domain-containing protein [Propionibacteriaceae bacterium]|nr:protein phosphatase 2C domain-containing protein [Propionibacteriaceae bacterium]
MAYSLRFQAHSEVGRIRKNNQDSGYASPTMLMVADGMGGAAAGDLASAVAATMARDADEYLSGEEMLTHMEALLAEANNKLTELVSQDLTLDGMGTTFCGAMFDGNQLGLTHIGDSRCYLLRDGELRQLTHDHSWVQQLMDQGRLTPQQAATHPHRSLIIKVLNGQNNSSPDLSLVDVALGDRIMFCSDGLSGMIDDDRIREILGQQDLDVTVDDLTEAANEAGGHDNITVVVADVVEQDDARDAARPQLVGSAMEREIPDVGKPVPPPPAPAPTRAPAPAPKQSGAEASRYAPEPAPRRWPGMIAGALAVLLVIGGATWGVVAYTASRYYIAESDGVVAIYNGLPGSILGYELSSLTERTDVVVTDLPRFYQRGVANTIGASGLDSARETVGELRWKAERCVSVRLERLGQQPPGLPTPTTSPSGLSTSPPNYPTYLAPITPTTTEESDPEAC